MVGAGPRPKPPGQPAPGRLRAVLLSYWQAKGVHGPGLAGAVEAGLQAAGDAPAAPATAAEAPPPPPAHAAPSAAAAAAAATGLQALDWALGGELDAEAVSFMAIREPGLLEAEVQARVIKTLVTMSSVVGGSVLEVVEREPALLLQDVTVRAGEEPEELLRAWRAGLAHDRAEDFDARLGELEAYRRRTGDASVGFREGDNAALAAWARKVRADWRDGALPEPRERALRGAGFVFDADNAEWARWLTELRDFRARTGGLNLAPIGTDISPLLLHWASIQRVANRTGELRADRKRALDELGFDFTGVDPIHA